MLCVFPLKILSCVPSSQLGLIKVRNEEYFIEPVKDHPTAGRGGQQPHVVYRRSALPEHGRHRDKRAAAKTGRDKDNDSGGDRSDFCGVRDTGGCRGPGWARPGWRCRLPAPGWSLVS